jgi:hypothetical protein
VDEVCLHADSHAGAIHKATKTDHEYQEKLPVSVEKLMPMLMAFDQDVEITVKPHRKPVPAS